LSLVQIVKCKGFLLEEDAAANSVRAHASKAVIVFILNSLCSCLSRCYALLYSSTDKFNSGDNFAVVPSSVV